MLPESFHNRSQTKSKALFIILFLIIGTFLIFKLTQDGSKYASPFGTIKDEVRTIEKTKDITDENEIKQTNEKNKGILNTLIDKLGNFNTTITSYDEKVKNFTNKAKEFLENGVFNATNIEELLENLTRKEYEEEKQMLLRKIEDLKEAFKNVKNSSLVSGT